MATTFDHCFYRFTGTTFAVRFAQSPPPGYFKGRHLAFNAWESSRRMRPMPRRQPSVRKVSSSLWVSG